jgi:gliding motility-associated-like protein
MLVTAGSSANGIFSLTGLCPQPYSIQISQGANTFTEVFNVPSQTIDPGNAITLGVCSTAPNQNLNTAIAGLLPGGNWFSPSGLPVTLPQPASSFIDGWYQYVIPSGACDVITGVSVDAIQNAFPGISTTWLICDDRPAEDMLPHLNGNAEPNGQWFDFVTSTPVSNIFDPATMDSQTFLYMIDTVPGCNPVFAVLTVDENHQPYAGEDAAITVCENGPVFNMINYLGNNPEGGGLWHAPNGTPLSGNFNPATYVAGTYEYVIAGATPCFSDNAFLNVSFIADNPSGEPASITVCENGNQVNMLNALNGSPLAGGIWTNTLGAPVDGSFNPSIENPGTYYYNFPNVVCTPQNIGLTIEVESLPNAGNNNAITICENTASINLNGLLSVGADIGGTWTDAANSVVSSNFSPPESGNSFQFNYHVNGNICPDDNATFTITLETLTENPPDVDVSLCVEDEAIDLATFYPSYPTIVFENQNGTSANTTFDPSIGNSANFIAVLPSINSCPNGESAITIQVTQPLFAEDTVYTSICNSATNFNLAGLHPMANANNGQWYNSIDEAIAATINIDLPGVFIYRFISSSTSTCGGNELIAIVEVFEFSEAGPNEAVEYCNNHVPVSLDTLMPQTVGGNGSWSFEGVPYTSSTIDPVSSTTGSYVYFIAANGPCPADAAQLFVTIQNGIAYDPGEDIAVCAGSANQQIGESPLLNTSYSWSPTTNLSNSISANPTVLIPDSISNDITTNYQVIVTDGICTIEENIQITVYALPSFDIGNEFEMCAGSFVNLSANVVGNYEWTPAFLFDDNSLTNVSASPIQNTTITLEVTDEHGCSTQDEAEIIVHPKPIIIFEPEAMASCTPLRVFYYLNSESQHVDNVIWEIPGVNLFYEDTLETYLYTTGMYGLNLTVFSDFGCSSSAQFDQIMEVYEQPFASFTSEPNELTTIDPIAQFVDESVFAELYEWNFAGLGMSNEQSPVFEFPNDKPQNFEVCLKITSEHGCIDSTCRTLHLDNEYIFYAPNAITPDNDYINDVFLPVMRGFEESTYTLEIFNRWGDLIFFTNEYGQPWTGEVNSGDYFAQDGVYVWQVRVKDKENAEYREFRGSLTVFR